MNITKRQYLQMKDILLAISPPPKLFAILKLPNLNLIRYACRTAQIAWQFQPKSNPSGIVGTLVFADMLLDWLFAHYQNYLAGDEGVIAP